MAAGGDTDEDNGASELDGAVEPAAGAGSKRSAAAAAGELRGPY